MKYLNLLIPVLLIFFFTETKAQNRTISGQITYNKTGEVVSGIKVSVKKCSEFTLTDHLGNYILIIPDSIKNIEFQDFLNLQIEKVNIISKNIINLTVSKKKLSIYDTPIEELVNMEVENIEVITASLKLQNIDFAPSNVTVISHKMIEERGYQTLIDICQDIPGFDFLIYEDGGGEYPTFNMNRGVGTIGNTKMLIMVDGIIQNNISFNWSLLWTYENLLIDIERIEIIEGPGSSIYGAQAFTGIIHFITKKNFDGVVIKPFYGSNKTFGIDVFVGKNFKNNANLSIAFHKYTSSADGEGRYDPGNYFHNIKYPNTILYDYDNDGNYVTNTTNPIGGQAIPSGFQAWHNSFSFRTKLSLKNFEIGLFLWESNRGISSYLTAYEYNITNENSGSSSRGYHIYTKNITNFNDKLSLHTNLVFRSTNILPETSFSYLYRFPNLMKSYSAFAYQAYLEERLTYILSKKNDLLIGLRSTVSVKSPRVVSLNYKANGISETESSWNEAIAGNGLNVKETVPSYFVNEIAVYGVWNTQWTSNIASSFGVRYDKSSEYGDIVNPRLSLIYKPLKQFGVKFLYGTAFKQPSIFELKNEFRGNPNLTPEKITTHEIELFSKLYENKIKLKTNIFYSDMKDFIDKVPDASMPSGERYENKDKFKVAGLSFEFNYYINKNIRIYSNYMYLQGKLQDSSKWFQIERTAQHKINAGINIKLLNKKLNINMRANFVGKRKAQITNKWLQQYKGGYAPSYTKINFVISYKAFKRFTPQLIIENLFDEQFYGIGRESGNSFIDEYDYKTNSNPDGFVPSYHPQPGRTFLINMKFTF